MAYPNDLVGKAIQFQKPNNPLTAPNPNLILTGHGLNVSVPVFDYAPGHPGVGGAPPRPPRFNNLNAPWNISFLEYLPGEVTTVRLLNPVLTGPMSGCFLFRYTYGGPRIAHVGTHDSGPDSAISMRAKNNWKAYLAQTGATDIKGESPTRFYTPEERAQAKVGRMGGVPQVYGLFEPNRDSYAILLAPMSTDITMVRNMMLIVALKPMPLLNWSFIAAMPAFR